MKPIETSFKRIETKYVVSKEILDKLIQDLKEYLVAKKNSILLFF